MREGLGGQSLYKSLIELGLSDREIDGPQRMGCWWAGPELVGLDD
jgi:hypothetical protein